MKKVFGWILRKCEFMAVFAVCGALTVFILASSYETAFGKDLPYVSAVQPFDLTMLVPQPAPLADPASIGANQTNTKYEGTYGTPSDFKSSRSAVRLAIAPPLYAEGQWLSRASVAHYLITSPAKGANIGNMVIYLRGGPTTIPDAQNFKAGDNFFVDTKRDWRYLYKVDEAVTISSLKYAMSEAAKPRLFVVVQSPQMPAVVVAATLVNVQSAVQ